MLNWMIQTNQSQPRHILGQSDWSASVLPSSQEKHQKLQVLLSVGSSVLFVKNHPHSLFILDVPGTVGLHELGGGVGRLTSEDHQVQQGIGAQAVGTMH